MSDVFYRFRSVNNLLGDYKELERQTIYFAPPDQLNDPMEGYRNIVWKGDLIVWRNLFSHYLFCLERVSSLMIVGGEEYPINEASIPVFGNEESLPTEQYRKLFKTIKTRFLASVEIEAFIGSISKRSTPVGREELLAYLECVHLPALKIIFDVYIEEGLYTNGNDFSDDVFNGLKKFVDSDVVNHLEEALKNGEFEASSIRSIFAAQNNVKSQLKLAGEYQKQHSEKSPNKSLLLFEFTSSYLNRLEELVFPRWYTACFMSECENSSVWGHYGDNHKGMCLIFDSELLKKEPCISLNNVVSWGPNGPSWGYSPMEFRPVSYEKGFAEIDFFQALGQLPVMTLNSMWYRDENGNTSRCAQEMNVNENKWREDYWSGFIDGLTVKSKDWKYENEHRLILYSIVGDLTDKSRRTLTYKFSSLRGIIFGIKTSREDIVKVMKIIDKKYEENSREDFKFYQAYYCPEEHIIKKTELSLIRFSPDGSE